MDCNGGLLKLEKEMYKPSHTLNTDMDLMLAYNKPVKDSKHTIVQKWALGHADKKKKRQPIDYHSN